MSGIGLSILSGLLGAGRWLLDVGKAILDWIVSDIRHAVIAALLLGGLLLLGANRSLTADHARVTEQRDGWRDVSGKWKHASFAWKNAHAGLVQAVRDKTAEARALDEANLARVEREYEAIIERTSDDYEMRLAARSAAYQQLRDQLDRARASDPSGRGGEPADLPGSYTARCQAFGAAGCDELLADLPTLLNEAQANTDTLIALQTYVRGMLAVDVNGSQAGEVQP